MCDVWVLAYLNLLACARVVWWRFLRIPVWLSWDWKMCVACCCIVIWVVLFCFFFVFFYYFLNPTSWCLRESEQATINGVSYVYVCFHVCLCVCVYPSKGEEIKIKLVHQEREREEKKQGHTKRIKKQTNKTDIQLTRCVDLNMITILMTMMKT